MARFYLDTCIWIDILEDRVGFGGEPLGGYGARLLLRIIRSGGLLIISDLLLRELAGRVGSSAISSYLAPFKRVTVMVRTTESQELEAKRVASDRRVPRPDALHAILARDHRCVLVTRDRHFEKLCDVVLCVAPERLLGSLP